MISEIDLQAAREVDKFKMWRRVHILLFLFACFVAYLCGGPK